ncbi:hypothetical protein [Rhodococcus sp. NCIMB 12038]|uniref:hypothetical protein n=1 Tax=Rhodococcus sp. NCIMB 12038 TaxID=933800 RepID=UPI000B3D34B9|nr:hypothetical protein [Rhodococcus sp. NCIMB 12038]OUS97219.1 hypothetical protein CA951_02420 [Rhodococcus sp. NCIMB 12038]
MGLFNRRNDAEIDYAIFGIEPDDADDDGGVDDLWDEVSNFRQLAEESPLAQIDSASDQDIHSGDRTGVDFEEELGGEIFNVTTEDVVSRVESLRRGGPAVAEPPSRRSGRFSTGRLDEVTARIAAEQAAKAEETSFDLEKMSKEQRKLYIEALGESLELYGHLVAIKPREKYVFRSDYYKIDGAGAVACILALFHRNEARDEFPAFWGVSRIPADLPEGVSAIVFEQVERKDEKWVDAALARADKLDRLEEREQADGGTMSTKRTAAKAADDLYSTVAELGDGAAYLSVHNRILLHAPSLAALDSAVDKLARQYIDAFSSLHAAPYHGEQRQELSSLFVKNDDKRGNGFHMTSTEFAGSYSLVTNGLSDPAGEFVGKMGGDYNNSAILFEVDRWRHHVVLADQALNHALDRARVVDMWGSKISQAALLNNHRVVHLVLNGADLNTLGPPLEKLTARLDMTRGDVNMFELFGSRKDQLSLYGIHLTKLVLMAEQALGAGDPAAVSIIRSELKDRLTEFYVDQKMWARSAEKNQEKLRLVGLDHNEVPLLQHFVPYLDTMYKKLVQQSNQDTEAQRAIKTLQGVFKDMLQANSDLFNQPTSYEIDSAHSARRVIYDFSGLVHRSKGLAMAQLVNIVGFAVASLREGDVLLIHGADQITDTQVQEYLSAQFERLFRVGARVGYLYENPDSMLENQRFNRFERADYTILGPMAKETISNYEQALHTAIPTELKTLLAATDLAISYLRRGSVNVVFGTELSLGLKALRGVGASEGMEDVAARVRETDRANRIADNSEVAALDRAEQERAQIRRDALTDPDRDDGRPDRSVADDSPARR